MIIPSHSTFPQHQCTVEYATAILENSVSKLLKLTFLEVLPFSFSHHQPFENEFLLINF